MPKEIRVNTFEWKDGNSQHRNGRHKEKPNGNCSTEGYNNKTKQSLP